MIVSSRLYVAAALVLVGAAPSTEACSCFPPSDQICDYVVDAEIVVHATVLTREEVEDPNADTAYTLQSEEVFKDESDGEGRYVEGTSFEMSMSGTASLCGIFLDIGEEYLIDLYRSDNETRAVGACGITRLWSTVTDEEASSLRNACADYDPCEGACGEFQQCETSISYSASVFEYTCRDTCEPSPCAEGEECELVYEGGCALYGECIPQALCDGVPPPTPAPAASEATDTAQTLPPGNYIESSTSESHTPAPHGGRDIAMTLPPGNYIDSTTGTETHSPSPGLGHDSAHTTTPTTFADPTAFFDPSLEPSPSPGRDIALTLPPNGYADSSSRSSTYTPWPWPGGDESHPPQTPHSSASPTGPGTPPPSTLVTAAPSQEAHRDIALTLSPGNTLHPTLAGSTSMPTASPTPANGDGDRGLPTSSSETSSPTGAPTQLGSGGDDGVGAGDTSAGMARHSSPGGRVGASSVAAAIAVAAAVALLG